MLSEQKVAQGPAVGKGSQVRRLGSASVVSRSCPSQELADRIWPAGLNSLPHDPKPLYQLPGGPALAGQDWDFPDSHTAGPAYSWPEGASHWQGLLLCLWNMAHLQCG